MADSSGNNDDGTNSSSRFSPMEEFLNPTNNAQFAGEEEYAAKEKQIQELITTCMAAQGFDYVPFVYPVPTSTAPPEVDPESRDYVATYGYGVSTVDSGAINGPSEVVDPNTEIVEAMSESERMAYYIALHGGDIGATTQAPAPSSEAASTEAVSTDPPSTQAIPTGAVESESPVSLPQESFDMGGMSMPALQDQGCWGQAQAEVFGDMTDGLASPDVQAQFQGMWDAISAMYTEIESHPQVKTAVAAWTDCMAAGGHPGLTGAWDAPQQVHDKWAELNGWGTGGAFSSDTGSMMSVSAGPSPSAPPADEVAAFREYEIALALADWDCKESSGFTTVSNDVRIELETAFVQEHRTELEQYRDIMNGGG